MKKYFFSIFKSKFVRISSIYIFLFLALDFIIGNKLLNFLYDKNIIFNQEVYKKTVEENERKYRIRDKIFHHTFEKNISTPSYWGSFQYTTCTDENGFRILCNSSKKFKKNLILIGDSFTEGIGLDYDKTFAGMMTKKWKINIHNMSVASYSPLIYKKKVNHFLNNGLKTNHVIVFIDISDVVDENLYFLCEDTISICSNRDSVSSNLLQKKNERLPLYGMLKKFIKKQKRKIFPKNIIYEKDFHRSSWTYQIEDKNIKDGIQKSIKNMSELYSSLSKKNISLSIVVYPWPGQILYDVENSKQVKIWREFCENKCKNFINLFPIFFEKKKILDNKELLEKYYLNGDVHFNEQGHKLIFDTLDKLNKDYF